MARPRITRVIGKRGAGAVAPAGASANVPNIASVPNNATELVLWTAGGFVVGDPYNVNGPQAPMTTAKMTEWATQRMIGGPAHATKGGFITSGVELEIIKGSDRYTNDGSLPMTPETTYRAWYQQALKNQWTAGNFFQQLATLGFNKPCVAMHTFDVSGTDIAFRRRWDDDASWGASTVAGALTPGVGSLLEDYIEYCKSVYAAGYGGVYFDAEQVSGWGAPESGDTEQVTRDFVTLRAKQLALITATYIPVAGGPEMGMYKADHTGSLKELIFYMTQNGTYPEDIFDYHVSDSFITGLACESGVRGVWVFESDWYRNHTNYIPGDSSANDNDATKYANAAKYDFGKRRARMSQMLAQCTNVTNAEALAAMRKIFNCMAIWPDDEEGAGPMTPAQFDVQVREAVKWSMGRIFQYRKGNAESAAESPPFNEMNQYEASYTTWLVPGVAATQSPTVAITGPTSSPTHSSAGATLTVSGTLSTDTAIARVEVVNSTTGVTVPASFTCVVDDALWNPLSSTAKPRQTSLGLVDFARTFTVDVARSVGANVITVNAYTIHSLVGSDTLTSTRTS